MSAVPTRGGAPPQDNPTMFFHKKSSDATALPAATRRRPYFKPVLIARPCHRRGGRLPRLRASNGDGGQKDAKKAEDKVVSSSRLPT
jgi:hypothetical protein